MAPRRVEMTEGGREDRLVLEFHDAGHEKPVFTLMKRCFRLEVKKSSTSF